MCSRSVSDQHPLLTHHKVTEERVTTVTLHMKTAGQGTSGDDSPAVSEIFWKLTLSLPQLVTGWSECAGFGLQPPLRGFLLSQMQAHLVIARGWSHRAKSGPKWADSPSVLLTLPSEACGVHYLLAKDLESEQVCHKMIAGGRKVTAIDSHIQINVMAKSQLNESDCMITPELRNYFCFPLAMVYILWKYILCVHVVELY